MNESAYEQTSADLNEIHHFARRIDTLSFNFGISQLISSPSYYTFFAMRMWHMSNWIRPNAFDFVKHNASTTSAHSVRQIALALTLLLFIFDMEHWISAEAFYIDLISSNFGKLRWVSA